MREARSVEGDLILIKTRSIFDVKGLVHPPRRVIAFPRFVPTACSDRGHGGIAYEKVYDISARFKFLEQNFPSYIIRDPVFDERLCEVPLCDIRRYYKPVDRLEELRCKEKLDELEKEALEFLELLQDYASVPWNKMGVSGSLLVKLHTPNSDIDPIIYGSKNCRRVHESLKTLTQDPESPVKPYSMGELEELFKFRVKDTQMSLKDFEKTESRKVLQGRFKNIDYFIRFVKDWSKMETEYGAIRYKNVGYAKIRAEIQDDSEAIFTPCSYKVKNLESLEGVHFPVEEIASFRGRFCEQARIGEVVIAQGKVERVMDRRQNREYFRLLLGNKPADYMVLA